MDLCKNGLYTAQTFDELMWVLLWNCKGWDLHKIAWLSASLCGGVYANCEGRVPAKVRVGMKAAADSKYIHEIQGKLLAPCLGKGYEYISGTGIKVLTEDHYSEYAGDPSFKSAVLFAEVKYISDPESAVFRPHNNGRMNADGTPNLEELLEDVSANRSVLEKFLGKSFDQVERFVFGPGVFQVHRRGSLADRETHNQWLKTIPQGISIKRDNGREYVLMLNVQFQYPSMEVCA